MLSIEWSLLLCLASCGAAATLNWQMRPIPNWLTLPLSTSALVIHAVLFGASGLCAALLGCLLCFLPAYLLSMRGALEGGEVKLFSALGALLGPREGVDLELMAIAMVTLGSLRSLSTGGPELPLGTAILGAVLATCLRRLW